MWWVLCQGLSSYDVLEMGVAFSCGGSQGSGCSRICPWDPELRGIFLRVMGDHFGDVFWGSTEMEKRRKIKENLWGFILWQWVASAFLDRIPHLIENHPTAGTTPHYSSPLCKDLLEGDAWPCFPFALISLSLWNQAMSPEALFWLSWGHPPCLQCQIQKVKSHLSQINCLYWEFIPVTIKLMRMLPHLIRVVLQFDTWLYPFSYCCCGFLLHNVPHYLV